MPCAPHQPDRSHAARGFTALELMLALALTGIIGLCIYALTGASSQIWKQQQEGPQNLAGAGRTQSYVERVLRVSHDVGYWAPGSSTEPASLLLWAHDLGTQEPGATRDYQIQQLEMVLIRFDESTGKIKLYRAKNWDDISLVDQLVATALVSELTFGQRLTADTFAAAPWVDQYVIAGGGGQKVTKATWTVDRTTDNPIVRFRIEMGEGDRAQVTTGVVGLRMRSSDDDWTSELLKLEPLTDDSGGDSGGDDGDIDFSLDLFP